MKQDEKDPKKDNRRFSGGMTDAEFDSLFDDPEEGAVKKSTRWWERSIGDDDGYDDDWWMSDRRDGSRGYSSYGYGGGSSIYGKAKGALSDWWGGRSGGFKKWWGGSKGDGNTIAYSSALQTVRRIGRIIHGDKLTFSWLKDASEVKEHAGISKVGNIVQLSPEPLTATGLDSTWTEGRKVDALVGDTMARAAHYTHVAPTVRAGMVEAAMESRASRIARQVSKPEVERPLAEAGKSLFNALDYLYSERRVSEGFPGYKGYFGAERDFVHRPSKKAEVGSGADTALAEDPKALMAAAAGTLWNTLRPQDKLELPEEMDTVVSGIAQNLREAARSAETPAELLAAATKALEELAQYTVIDNPDCKAGEGDENGQGMKGMAGEMGMADRGEPGKQLDDEQATEIEQLVSREYTKEEGAPSIGKGYGNAEVPVYSIRAKPEHNAFIRSLRIVRPLVARARRALMFRNELQSMDEVALRRGMVDEGSLHKLMEDDPTVFRRQDIIAAPEVDIGFLVDESGSMGMPGSSGSQTRAEIARLCAILLVEACRGLRGVSTSVWGHTGNCDLAEDGALVYRYMEAGDGDINGLGGIRARSQNFDGHAIHYCVKKMRELGRAGRQKILFVLADGYPSGHGYGGRPGMDHVRDVCMAARKNGVEVYCLGMGDGLKEDGLAHMYGEQGFVIVPEVQHLPRVLSKLLGRVLRTGRVA